MSEIQDLQLERTETIDGCCPVFNPSKWDGRPFVWNNKKFIKATIPTFLHMPIPAMIDKNVAKLMRQAEAADALDEDMTDTLLLFHDPHAFKSELLLSVTREVQGAQNETLSGTYVAKVYDGPYSEIRNFIKDMDRYIHLRGQEVEDLYIHYAYCPKCAEKAGHNYMVFFALIPEF